MSYPFNIKRAADLTVTLDGSSLAQGDIVTGSDVRDIVIAHDTAKVTNEIPSPTGQEGSHHLYLKDADGNWDRILSQQYGDYFYYAQTVSVGADRAKVLVKTADVVEVEWEWDAFNIAAANLDRITPEGTIIYAQSSATSRKHSTIQMRKRVRMVKGIDGYFVGVDAEPYLHPGASTVALFVEESNFGEQECGLGTGSAVTFSSASVTARHPAAGTHVNMELGSQATGPWWMASIPGDTSIPYVRYLCTRGPLSSRSYQFGAPDYGVAVIRHLYQVYTTNGAAYRHQVFIGAMAYTADSSSSFANEPTLALQTAIASLASNLAWPDV